MLDSLVRVSRRVLRVPKAIASPTGNSRFGQSKISALLTAANTRARDVSPRLRSKGEACGGPDAHTHIRENGLVAARYRACTVVQSAGRPRVCRVRRSDATGAHSGRRPTHNGSRRSTRGEVHDYDTGAFDTEGGVPSLMEPRRPTRSIAHQREPAPSTMNLPIRSFGFLRFTPERFHVLLNSLFKVLFNFPSRYLFAIGLVVVFSLRWSLPPT